MKQRVSTFKSWLKCAAFGFGLALLAACGTLKLPVDADEEPAAASPPAMAASAPPAPQFPDRVAADLKTRNAIYKASSFSDLPGWLRDDLLSAQDALQGSCRVLATREAWRAVCAKSALLPRTTGDLRNFFEREFAVFRVLRPDTSRDGLVGGYYEPLINGSAQPEGAFTVPVYGTPHDLYTLDWGTIPPEKRQGTVFVAKKGRQLTVLPGRQRGSFALDTSRFVFDGRERTWRVQLLGERALPYPTRAAITGGARFNAPVLAYVDDAVALYALQQQGVGRIRLSNGTVLRLQYAEHNGHPFRPLRVISKTHAGKPGRAALDAADTFELAEAPDDWLPPAPPASVAPPALVGSTSTSPAPAASPPPTPPTEPVTPKGKPSAIDTILGKLLGRRSAPADPSEPAPVPPAADASNIASSAVVNQLLGAASAPPVRKPPVSDVSSVPVTPKADAAVNPRAVPKRPLSVRNDPSYVFFKLASDPSTARGPEGTLGIALTPGRSVAVDPRVLPMGYPAFISSTAIPAGSALGLQRLVLAQDTHGAVEGAVRANFFWGQGAEVGRQASRTRQRGQMWLLMPHAEADRMRATGLFTGTVGAGEKPGREDAECLVSDDTYCVDR